MGIRLLHIISGDLWAGAEAMAYQLLSGLNRCKGIELHLIILNEGRLNRLLRQEGIACHLIDEQKLCFGAIVWSAIKIARKIKPNIIHAHRYKENILAALVAFSCGHPKLVTTQHGRAEANDSSFPKSIIKELNYTCLRMRFAQVVAVSNDTADYMMKSCGLKASRLAVIPNGLELPSRSLPLKSRGKECPFTVGTAGRLFPVKNFEAFIEIARRVCQKKPQTRFIIAGEGPERQKLQAKIAQYDLQRHVNLVGHLEVMQEFYADLDLYLNTSLHEGAPMTILEAMGNGIPVVAFGVAGIKEIVTDGMDGFCVPKSNIPLFISRIISFIDNPALLSAFGACARLKIRNHFSKNNMIDKYLNLYHNILKPF